MLHDIRKHKQGFTIIEVMIVLAIAGLIMLIIFLAVPALQRSSRNTQRKNDVAAIASAVANYIDNNGGVVPSNTGGTDPDLLICGSSCSTGNTETAKLGIYAVSKVNFVTSPPGNLDTSTVDILPKYNCNSNNTGPGSPGVGRTVAILYAVETSSSSSAQQCTEQ